MLNIYELIKEIEESNQLEKKEKTKEESEEKTILNKTYVKINKPYDWFIEEINKNKAKLQEIMKEKREILEKIREKENLKIKIAKNLEEIKKGFYQVYALLLSEEGAPPLIIKSKIKEKKSLFKDLKIGKDNESKENSKEIKNLSVLEKIERELKKIEKELKELGITQ